MNIHKQSAVAALSMFCILVVFSPALGAAIYTARSEAQLSIVDIRNLTLPGQFQSLGLVGDAFVTGEDGFTAGDGVAEFGGSASVDADNLFDLAINDSVILASEAEGQSINDGAAFSFHVANGFVDLLNFSNTEVFEIDFQLDYGLTAMVEVDDPLGDMAIADASLIAFTLSGAFELVRSVSAEFGSGPIDVMDSQFFTLTLAPLAADAIELTTIAQGESAAVPIPAALYLFMTLLLPLAIVARRAI